MIEGSDRLLFLFLHASLLRERIIIWWNIGEGSSGRLAQGGDGSERERKNKPHKSRDIFKLNLSTSCSPRNCSSQFLISQPFDTKLCSLRFFSAPFFLLPLIATCVRTLYAHCVDGLVWQFFTDAHAPRTRFGERIPNDVKAHAKTRENFKSKVIFH